MGAQGTRLERATKRFDSGDYKKALKALWWAEAEHRADGPRLREALSLAQALVGEMKGLDRASAEILVSVVASDIERLDRSPLEGATTEAQLESVAIEAPAHPRFGLIAGCTALAAIILFFVGAGLVVDNLFTDSAWGDIGAALVLLSFASALVSLGAAIAWLVTALTRQAGERPATRGPNGEARPGRPS